MFRRIAGALTRGILVALMIATPSLLLPGYLTDATEIVALLAIVGAGLTFAEYYTNFPSIVEFRDAPPLNRLRFIALLLMVLMLTLATKNAYEPTAITAIFNGIGQVVGHYSDFPYSPIRLVIGMLPDDISVVTMERVRDAAGVAYAIALASVVVFLGAVRLYGWPTRQGAFNVWVNLPRFDPTTGGDVVHRLQRDGRINAVLGILLPFLIPTLVRMASDLIDPITVEHPQTMIWTISAWAFLPASMIMRGIAMIRIAELIEEKRRRASQESEPVRLL
ncbi:hypothetical protein [Sedimentitalea todarodis]|uniref:Uncharacterized protein n=1 Tax=Sedimentitalea todarodis TaxID=1631240 RepID=A0ABU3VAA7_9RHOB|nr:hypothetical protein [Sedimentitalea todarodis]MDU9003102.1 hypothetical protein [Sedimentitalea todarodis]